MTTRTKTAPAKSIEAATAEAKQTIENLVKAGQDATAKNYEQVVAVYKEQVEKALAQLQKSYEEAAAFGKQNVDAVVKSGTIVSKGYEDIAKAMFDFGHASIEVALTTTKAALGVKTLKELVDLQSEFAKSSFDSMVAEGTKISELGVKVANEALEPINARVNAAVQKLTTPIAA